MDAALIPGVSVGHFLMFLTVGLCFRALRRLPWLYVAARLPGTFAHEALHFIVGFVLGAKPVSLSIRPRRTVAGRLVYGEVAFTRLRWWNEVPIGLAPLLLLPLAIWLFSLACLAAPGEWISPVLMVLVWECLMSCVPSLRDMFHVIAGATISIVVVVAVILILELLGVPHV